MRTLFPLPPPILCFSIGIGMYFLPLMLPYPRYPSFIWACILCSGFLAITSSWQFYRHKTTIDPQQLNKTAVLVTSGIFRFTRNPMYLSLLIGLITWALWLGNLAAWIGVVAFVFIINRFQIAREEKYLEEKFCEDYRRYKAKVRRWI